MIEKIKKEIESVEYFIEKSPKTNEYTVALKKNNKKQYILSKYKPREQAIKQLNNDWGNKDTIWILIGYGFGYMAEALLNHLGNDTSIIIIEPNQELLKEQLKVSPIRKEAKYIYFITTNEIMNINKQLQFLIPKTEMYNISIRYLAGYLEYYELTYKYIIEKISELKYHMEVNFYTILRRQEENYLNCLKNARYISENHDIYHLCKICENIPALIVCAGPSLEKNIDEIKNFKGIIVAIGRTMTPLHKRGITPDLVINVDPTDLVYETFGECKEHNIPLLTPVESNAKVVAGSHGEKYFIYNNSIITNIFKTSVNPTTAFYSSVSTLCLSFTEFLGCNPIIMVGQDLAYTGQKYHAGDTKNIEKTDIGFGKMIKGYDGQMVQSDEGMISIIRWMETQMLEYPDILHINATEGGAYIEGMLHMPLKKAIEKYCIKDKPKITHAKLLESQDINYEKCMQEAKTKLDKIQRLAKTIMSYYKQLEIEYAKDNKKSWTRINKCFNNIDKAEKSIQKVPDSEVLIKMLSEKIRMVLEANNENKARIEEKEWEENVRIMRNLYERYYYLAKECENFIKLIDIAMNE